MKGDSKIKAPSLSELVTALLDPGAYPYRPEKVEMVQTHLSAVFLAGDIVYKIKKPVNFGFVDFTTLEKRLYYCNQEVKLNRRLCSDTYLGVVAVTRDGNGYRVEGTGEAVEYAVKMRRLPFDRTMDRLLQANQVTAQMVEQVARKLVDFHRQAGLSPEVARLGGLETVIQNTEENFAQTEKYYGLTISPDRHKRISGYTRSFLKGNAALFQKREKEGRVKDCHGDLHAAHICFADGVCIFDCIEFNERFRYVDVASEVAFLAMDLDRYSRADLSRSFIDAYVELSGDKELLKLLDFYKCYRAYVRGKVDSFQLDDPQVPLKEKERVVAVASRYFELAESYTTGGER